MSTNSNTRLLDVARRAGVSPATVSRVLNQTAHVNEGTRARVLSAIADLDYKPVNLPPPTRVEQKTVALLITDILNPFFPEVVRGVEDETGASGLSMLLYNTSEDPQREALAIQSLMERPVDGIIACASRVASKRLVELFEEHNTPLVVINRYLHHSKIPCIMIDFEDAAYRVTQHLLKLNHKRFAYLAGFSNFESSLARRHGIERALHEAHLTLPEAWCPMSFPNVEGGFQAMSMLLSLPRAEGPTAVIAYNDIMAIGALHAIRRSGLTVPNDISVVGFDGIAMAAHTNPPLTTIEQPKYRMGQLAMQILYHMIEGQDISGYGYTLLESPLIVRESTSLAPDSN